MRSLGQPQSPYTPSVTAQCRHRCSVSKQALICSIRLLILGGINRLNEEGRKKKRLERKMSALGPKSSKYHSKVRGKAAISSSRQCELCPEVSKSVFGSGCSGHWILLTALLNFSNSRYKLPVIIDVRRASHV